MRKNVLLMKNEFAYGTLHIQRIETRAFTQDTSTSQKEKLYKQPKVIINLTFNKKLSEKKQIEQAINY